MEKYKEVVAIAVKETAVAYIPIQKEKAEDPAGKGSCTILSGRSGKRERIQERNENPCCSDPYRIEKQ